MRHMICTTRRADGIEETPPELSRVIGSPSEALRTVLERCTQPNDKVLIAGPKAGRFYMHWKGMLNTNLILGGNAFDPQLIFYRFILGLYYFSYFQKLLKGPWHAHKSWLLLMCMGLNITKSLFVWSRNVSYIYYNFSNHFSSHC